MKIKTTTQTQKEMSEMLARVDAEFDKQFAMVEETRQKMDGKIEFCDLFKSQSAPPR